MALKLSDLKKVRADKPPRVLIYGPPGIGKTTLASEFPAPVFLQIEDGTPADLELTSFGKIDDFNQLMEALPLSIVNRMTSRQWLLIVFPNCKG